MGDRPSDPRASWSARRFALEQKLRERLEQPGVVGRAGRGAWEASFWIRERVVPSRRRARKLDRGFDEAHGTDTRGYFALGDESAEAKPNTNVPLYEATRPSKFAEAMARVPIRHEDFVFVDLGSGKGRALLLASDWPFKRIVGVEFSEELNEIAVRNIAKYRPTSMRCHAIESLAMDAKDYPLPEDNLLVYLYNPFPPDVMREVLEKIRRSSADHPRDVYLLYAFPALLDSFDEFDFTPLEINKDFVLYKV